jgi:hypothetical protein
MQQRLVTLRNTYPKFDRSMMRVISPDFIDGPIPNLATEQGQDEIDEIIVRKAIN